MAAVPVLIEEDHVITLFIGCAEMTESIAQNATVETASKRQRLTVREVVNRRTTLRRMPTCAK